MSTYFLSAVMPGDADEARMVGRMQGSVYRVALEPKEVVVAPARRPPSKFPTGWVPRAQDAGRRVRPAGPQRGPGHVQHHRQGPLWLLEFFQQYTHNWGLSIIMLTIVIKAVFWPLTAKSYSSMEKMKKLQPMMVTSAKSIRTTRKP